MKWGTMLSKLKRLRKLAERNAPSWVALIALVLTGAVSGVIILHGIAYDVGSSSVNNVMRAIVSVPVVLTWLSYQCVKGECFGWVVGSSAAFLLLFSFVAAMSIGLFYLPSALMLGYAVLTMEE